MYEGDRLQQRVLTSFRRRDGSPNQVDLKIGGAAFLPKQLLGVSLEAVPPLKVQGFFEAPFGSFEVLYCEGPEGPPEALVPEMAAACQVDGLAGFGNCASIRVVRTQQGYVSINRRIAEGDGWGSA